MSESGKNLTQAGTVNVTQSLRKTFREDPAKRKLCKKCNRRRVKQDNEHCERCLILIEREKKGPKEKTMKPTGLEEGEQVLCKRCGRREVTSGHAYCERCLVLINRAIDQIRKEKAEKRRKVKKNDQRKRTCTK
jgi:hypothetical protein